MDTQIDAGALSNLLNILETAFKGGVINLQGASFGLMRLLVGLEIAFFGLWSALSGDNLAKPFLKKLLMICFFQWVVTNFGSLTSSILNSFTAAGAIAAGVARYGDSGDQISAISPTLTDPSSILTKFAEVQVTIASNIKETSVFSLSTAIASALLALFFLVPLSAAFLLVIAQIFITRLEFALFSTIGIILVPFAAFKHTSFIAERVFGGIFSYGIKLMMLTFLLTVTWPMIERTSYDLTSLQSMCNATTITLVAAFLIWRVPTIAAGVIAGGPSLGLGIPGPAATVISGAVATTGSLARAGSAATVAGAGATVAAARTAARTLAAATGPISPIGGLANLHSWVNPSSTKTPTPGAPLTTAEHVLGDNSKSTSPSQPDSSSPDQGTVSKEVTSATAGVPINEHPTTERQNPTKKTGGEEGNTKDNQESTVASKAPSEEPPSSDLVSKKDGTNSGKDSRRRHFKQETPIPGMLAPIKHED